MRNLDLLSAAVVRRACYDYLILLADFPQGDDFIYEPKPTIEELEEFFTSDTFDLYSNLDGKTLMHKIQELAKRMVRTVDVYKVGSRYVAYWIDSDKPVSGKKHKYKKDAVAEAAEANHVSMTQYTDICKRDGAVNLRREMHHE